VGQALWCPAHPAPGRGEGQPGELVRGRGLALVLQDTSHTVADRVTICCYACSSSHICAVPARSSEPSEAQSPACMMLLLLASRPPLRTQVTKGTQGVEIQLQGEGPWVLPASPGAVPVPVDQVGVNEPTRLLAHS
jgi:hypothetical protein